MILQYDACPECGKETEANSNYNDDYVSESESSYDYSSSDYNYSKIETSSETTVEYEWSPDGNESYYDLQANYEKGARVNQFQI